MGVEPPIPTSGSPTSVMKSNRPGSLDSTVVLLRSSSRRSITAAVMMLLLIVMGLSTLTMGVQAAPLLTTKGQPLDFNSYQHIFAFGDSYTASGYDPALGGIDNITYFGNTSSNGLNWFQLLALQNPNLNASRQIFDLAVFGATTNNNIVPSGSTDFVDQVSEFQKYFLPPPAAAPWQSDNTLFVIWIGINDVGFGFLDNIDYMAAQPLINQTWVNMIDALYSFGARDFLVLGVPPTDLTPLVQSYGAAAVATFAGNVDKYNAMLASFIPTIPLVYPGTKAILFDTQPFFNAILTTPFQYGFTDSTTVCPYYITLTNDPFADSPFCPWPFVQYVWGSSYHPTWPVHALLATVVLEALDAALQGSNIDSGATIVNGTTITANPTYIPTATPKDTSSRSVANPTATITSAAGSIGGTQTSEPSSATRQSLDPLASLLGGLFITFAFISGTCLVSFSSVN